MQFFLNILSIFLLMSAGWVIRKRGLVDDVFTRRLSVILVNVFYPCLILNALLSRFTLETLIAGWYLPACLFGIFFAGWLVGTVCLRVWQGAEPATRRTFHFGCAVNNYTFLPIMLARPLWGDEAVAMIAFAALGAEIFVWTLGIRSLSGRHDLKQLLSTPLVALLCASFFLLLRHFLPLDSAPVIVHDLGKMLLSTAKTTGEATIPVSALICGARLGALDLRGNFTPPAWIFTALRLLFIPALCVAILSFLPLDPMARNVLLLIAVQPIAMAAVPMSEVYGGHPAFAATTVFLTHALCLATIPLWMWLLGVV